MGGPRPDRWAYSFRPDAAAIGRTWLGRVARLVAAESGPAGCLVERRVRDPVVSVIPDEPTMGRAIERAALDLAGALRRRPSSLLVAARPPPGVAVAFLVGPDPPRDRRSPGDDARTAASDRRPGLNSVGPGLPIAGQSHWFPAGGGQLRVWTRLTAPWGIPPSELRAAALELVDEAPETDPVQVEVRAARRFDRTEWVEGSLRRSRGPRPAVLAPAVAPDLLPRGPVAGPVSAEALRRHTVVVGSSGSGKTSWVARLAATRIAAGHPVLLFDVHGDLAPAVVAHLPEPARARVIAIDAERPADEIPGVSILGTEGHDTEPMAAAVVAALKRLSASEGEVYWGFRLERIFDTLVRAVQDEGGSLLDLLALLTDERRREATRLSTRRPEVARFLDELPAILRRSPDFLWPAASRLSKLGLDPRLAALVSPRDEGIPLASWVERRGSVLWRLPLSTLGPEGASLSASLIASRTYLTLARRPRGADGPTPVLMVIDEAQTISSRLLTEILAEGRKFGVGLVIATQYPERMAPELRHAAAGAAGTHVVFRVPPAAARELGNWAGLSEAYAQAELPRLSMGEAVWTSAGRGSGRLRSPAMPRDPWGAWDRVVAGTSSTLERGVDAAGPDPQDADVESVLLALLDPGGPHPPTTWAGLEARLGEREFDPVNAETLHRIWPTIRARGWVTEDAGAFSLTAAGERYLGVGAPTFAARESVEHRALLVEAVRVFARHGLRMEIVRQGRFDTRLPDGVVRLLGPRPLARAPREIAEVVEGRRRSWAWRAFGGRDLYLEAEVSGAERRARILNGIRKAERAGAAVVFLVGDARRARRVRSVLREHEVPIDRGQVWTMARVHGSPPRTLHRD